MEAISQFSLWSCFQTGPVPFVQNQLVVGIYKFITGYGKENLYLSDKF